MGISITGLVRQKRLRLIAVALLLAAFLCPASGAAAAQKKKRRTTHHTHFTRAAPQPDRFASIVVDAATGTVLSEKNADKRLYPASLTKMMTLYLTFEALDNGTLRKSDRIPVSSHAAVQEPSSLALEAGSDIRVEDAILGLVTKSANDAAVVLGERLGGSESRFGAMMTAKARQLGMTNTQFLNASGLFNPAQVSSARDMATLALALLRDHPRHYRYFSTPSFTWAGQEILNHNKLMAVYSGMDGIKTGYVHQSGFNLVASAVRGGRRLVGVIFGGKTSAARNAQMALLLNAGFVTPVNARVASAARPGFDAMGLALKNDPYYAARRAQPEEGDTSAAEDPVPAAVPATAPVAPAAPPPSVARVPVRADNPSFAEQLRPKPLDTRPLGAYKAQPGDEIAALNVQKAADAASVQKIATAAGGGWAVQIGAYGSSASGLQALAHAQKRLAQRAQAQSRPIIVPLATNRGTIYRARLTGLDRAGAENACRVLKGTCLVLAVQ